MTVPDSDHIARYCKPMAIEDGRLLPTAFMLRPEEEYLSVNWLEYLNCSNRESEIQGVLAAYSAKQFKPKASSKIAVLNVGKVRQAVRLESSDGRNLRILHKPSLPYDPSHSGVHNISPDNELIAEIIVQLICDRDIYSTRVKSMSE